MLRGFNLTMFSKLVEWPDYFFEKSERGLPTLSTNFNGYKIQDVFIPFEVSIRDKEIIIRWFELGNCVAYDVGRVRLLISKGKFAGVLIDDVTSEEKNLFTRSGVGSFRPS